MRNVTLTPNQISSLRAVPHFRDSHYVAWDLQENLDFYTDRFVRPLLNSGGYGGAVADIGCGYGWLAMSLALHMQCKVYAVEPNAPRLTAARHLAAVLGVEDKITWLAGSIGAIPLADQSMDAVFCIEVIEHVGIEPWVMRDLGRVTRHRLTVTTPNGALPLVTHDARVPFYHWLPRRWRNRYVALFGQRERRLDEWNEFWTARRMQRALSEFQCISPAINRLKPNLRLTFQRR